MGFYIICILYICVYLFFFVKKYIQLTLHTINSTHLSSFGSNTNFTSLTIAGKYLSAAP